MKLFEDNIYNLLGMAEDYILKNIRWRSEITGSRKREDNYVEKYPCI